MSALPAPLLAASARSVWRRHGDSSAPPGPWTPTAAEKAMSMPAWLHQGQYARDTSYVLIGVFLFAAAMGLVRRVRRSGVRGEHYITSTVMRVPGSSKFLALTRALTYQKIPPSKYWSSPSVGAVLLITAFSVGELGMCFGPRPYYWRNRLVGSPPLAVRAGMMATAMFPWFWGLALKVNPFTWLLGVSHEKLQVYHQWLARICLFFSWVHTVPFIWQPNHDDAPGSARSMYNADYGMWASGCAALVFMTWMCFTSTSWVRSLGYEFFVFQHLMCTFGVLICMFIHTEDAISSWSYLWAVTAVWGASTLFKWSRILIGSTFGCAFDASIECVAASNPTSNSAAQTGSTADGVMQIAVQTPLKWQPGQHVFLRFPTVNPMTSHPFTITSLARDDTRESLMVLVARARDGQTKTLYDAVRQTSRYGEMAERVGLISRLPSEPSRAVQEAALRTHGGEMGEKDGIFSGSDSDSAAGHGVASSGSHGGVMTSVQSIVLPAMVDGPYGDPIRIAQYPSVLLLAGGIGITRIVPALLEAVETGRRLGGQMPLRSVGLVWSMSDPELVPWFASALRTAQHALEAMHVELRCDLYVTGESEGEASKEGQTAATKRDGTAMASDVDAIHTYLSRSGAAGPNQQQQQEKQQQPSWTVHTGTRAHIRKAVADWVDGADASGADFTATIGSSSDLTVTVAACGPPSFVHDASSAVARENVRLLVGVRKHVKQVALDEELFAY